MKPIEPLPRVDDSLGQSIIEALDHGRDGWPRWVHLAVPPRQRERVIGRAIASAEERGYVPVAVRRYWAQPLEKREELGIRTLLLNDDGEVEPARAHAVLLDAAARSPRPHILLTFQQASASRQPLVVREARAVSYGPPRLQRVPPDVARLLERASIAERFARAGRHAAAERLLREVAASLARRSVHGESCRVMLVLGQMLLDRGRPRAVFDVCDEAASVAQSGGDDSRVVEARLMQAEARIADAALVDAEALCRASLTRDSLPPVLRLRAQTLLGAALLWQQHPPDLSGLSVEGEEELDSRVRADAWALRVRVLLAHGRTFEAGQGVARIRALAASIADPRAEAAAHYADVAVLAAAGDLLRAEHALASVIETARQARLPLCAAWARLEWIDALRRAGRETEAERHLARLRRLARRGPRLLQREIAAREAGAKGNQRRLPAQPAEGASMLCTALVRLLHEDDDDEAAVRRLLGRVAAELQTARIDVVSANAGPPTIVCSVGDGLRTRLGTRVLEAALPVGPERERGGWELGLTVRLGSSPVGALVCRWPIDRAVPSCGLEVMELAAAVLAPRLGTWLSSKRDEAGATLAVPELIGVSNAIADVRKAIVRAAAAPFAVLIEGSISR